MSASLRDRKSKTCGIETLVDNQTLGDIKTDSKVFGKGITFFSLNNSVFVIE